MSIQSLNYDSIRSKSRDLLIQQIYYEITTDENNLN